MPLITLAIPNLLNGVSQQPAQLRFPTQGEVQENGYSSIVEGLVKRPPTEHVAKIINGAVGSCKVHTIDRDASEQYIVVLQDNSIKVFDKSGVEKTVNYEGSAQSYINLDPADDPNQVFKLLSIADYTFVVNTKKTTAMLTGSVDLSPKNSPEHQCFVWLRQATAGANVKIELKGTENGATTYTVSDSFGTSAGTDLNTDKIAADLESSINANPGPSQGGYEADDAGYVVRIKRTVSSVNTAFTATVWDGNGGNNLKLVKGEVPAIEDLPGLAPNGFIVKVQGDPEQNADDLWLKFENPLGGTTIGQGVWKETVAPGISYKLDATTMPHILVRNSNGTFTLKAATWADRGVGDADSNATPSFIGQAISDIFLFRGRLGFLSGENVVLSESGEYFNFWRTTVTDLLDADPIDVSSSYPEITLFKHAVPYDDRLIIFSDRAQFALTSPNTILTPTTTVMRIVGNYDALPNCAPALVGEEIFFAFDRGSYTGVREIIANFEDTQALISPDISANVPKYFPGKMTALRGTSHDNILVGVTDTDPTSLYVYKWYDSSRERVQASWSKWSFKNATIRGMAWMDESLYLAIERPEGLFLERITVKPNRTDDSSSYVVGLDRRVGLDVTSMSYDLNNDRTTITLPYQVHNTAAVRAVSQAQAAVPSYDFGSFSAPSATNLDLGTFTAPAALYLDYNYSSAIEAGISYTILSASGNTVQVRGNITNRKVWVGEAYDFKYRMSTPYLRRQGERGTEVYSTGRFQVRNVFLTFVRSSYFKVQVSDKYGATSFDSIFSGNLLGTGQGVLNAVAIEDGVYQVPVLMKNEDMVLEITSDSHLPVGFTAAEVEASYDTRSARR